MAQKIGLLIFSRSGIKNLMPLLISIGLHILLGAIGTIFVVRNAVVKNELVKVEMVAVSKPKLKRRMARRSVRRLHPELRSTTKKVAISPPPPQQINRITTELKLPLSDSDFALPIATSSPIGEELSVATEKVSAGKFLVPSRKRKFRVKRPTIKPLLSPKHKIKLPKTPPIDVQKIGLVDLSDVTSPPRFKRQMEPKYPDIARQTQREGVVILEATIGLDGTASEIKVISGIGFGCDKAAIEALKLSFFIPAKLGNKKVQVRIQIPYRFELSNSE